MFRPSLRKAIVFEQDENGQDIPHELIIKNCTVSSAQDSKTSIRLDCEFDELAYLNRDTVQVNVVPTTQPLDTMQSPDGSMRWREYKNEPGIKMMRTVYASAWTEVERTNCFCCTCSDNNPDPHCRNHGWAGSRACGKHKTKGESYLQEKFNMATGLIEQEETMPQSIEDYQRSR